MNNSGEKVPSISAVERSVMDWFVQVDTSALGLEISTEFTIFYAWQFDLPGRYSRYLIREALEEAIRRIRLDAAIEDSPRLDHDTRDVSGTPAIADTIFKKIESCFVFVADVSFIGRSESTDENKKPKSLPNPNVLLELGYAASKVGWNRIILAMNEWYGPAAELIFDLKNRRFPITFRHGPDSKAAREKRVSELAGSFQESISLALQHECGTVNDAISSLTMHCIQIMQKYCGEIGFITHFLSRDQVHLDAQIALDSMAIERLLDLRIIRLVGTSSDRCQYSWTYFGKQVLLKLGLRISPTQTTVTIA